jgi:hypothetical protein
LAEICRATPKDGQGLRLDSPGAACCPLPIRENFLYITQGDDTTITGTDLTSTPR